MLVMSWGHAIMKPSQSVTWRRGVRANVTSYSTAEITVPTSGQSWDCCSLSLSCCSGLAPAQMLTPFSSASSRIKFWIEHPNVRRGPCFELKRVFGCENYQYPVSVMMVISLYPMMTEISRRFCTQPSSSAAVETNQRTILISAATAPDCTEHAACTPL